MPRRMCSTGSAAAPPCMSQARAGQLAAAQGACGLRLLAFALNGCVHATLSSPCVTPNPAETHLPHVGVSVHLTSVPTALSVAVVDAEGDMFQTELDFGTMDAETFTRDVYQRCAHALGRLGSAARQTAIAPCAP